MTVNVATLGEALGLVRADHGRLIHTSQAAISIGGAEANVAIGLARLGAHSAWLGRIGDDAFGMRIRRELMAEGVETLAVVDATRPSALMYKEPNGPGRTRVTFLRQGSAGSGLALDDLALLDIPTRDHLHITGILPALSESCAETVRAAMHTARSAQVPISFDVNHRPSLWDAERASSVYRELARSAQIVFGDRSELALLSDSQGDDEALARAVGVQGPREVVLKRGERGAAAWDGEQWHEVPAVRVPVVDTVGAGDAFVAGYLWTRLNGGGIEAALATATRTGAAACTDPGDWEGALFAADLLIDGNHDDPVRR